MTNAVDPIPSRLFQAFWIHHPLSLFAGVEAMLPGLRVHPDPALRSQPRLTPPSPVDPGRDPAQVHGGADPEVPRLRGHPRERRPHGPAVESRRSGSRRDDLEVSGDRGRAAAAATVAHHK